MEKQESVSRQSSILKPPKQRQPLQCVAANPSSSENSPTIKIKRRVSFAKNKRIREFCNEAEQGTVWDNTYEEHDLSNPKNNSNDQPVIISVPCDDKENFPVQLFLKNNELDCKEISQSIPTEDGDNLSQCDMEMDNSINNFRPTSIEEQNNEKQYQNTTIYCDDGMDMTNYIPSEIIPCQRRDNDGVDILAPSSKNTSMEITQYLPLLSNKLIPHLTNDKNLLQSNSTDLTQAISALLSSGCAKKLSDPTDLETPNGEPSKSTMDYSNTAGIEFTSILPSSTWIKSNSQCQNEDKTENLTKSMEFTMAVPYTIQNKKNTDKSIGFSEKTNIFTNRSMEITEPIFTKNKNDNCETNAIMQEKTKLFFNNSMEMTKAVSIFDKIRQIENNVQSCPEPTVQEKTKIFVNNSMEMTEAIPILNKIPKLNDIQASSNLTSLEKTKVFANNSMEMTEMAIPVLNEDRQLDNNTLVLNNMTSQEKTKIFVNNSMEMTEAVPILNKVHQLDDNVQPFNNVTLQERTKIFLNTSMEMTEAVPILNKVCQLNDNSQSLSNMKTQDKTKIFLNTSMEMTEAVPILNKVCQLNDNSQSLSNMKTQDKTKIFSNNSMEVTETVPILSKVCQLNDSIQPLNNVTSQERTKIFSNNSMEMTESVPILNKIRQLDDNIQPLNNLTSQERTKIFSNNSMEMTEAVPILNKIRQLNDNIQPLNNVASQEKTKVFLNNSMEMTEAVPILNNIFQLRDNAQSLNNMKTQDKTKIFSNNTMEVTETVPILSKIRQLNDNTQLNNVTSQERTKIFSNNSMEMTEAVPILNKIRQLDDNIQPFTNSTIQEKTKLFSNHSMEITEAVPVYNNVANQTAQERTKIFSNHSMEITEAVPIINKHGSDNANKLIHDSISQEKTKVFVNTSMEITEAVPINRISTDVEMQIRLIPQENTKVLINNSVNITESIPDLAANRQCALQIDKRLHNISENKTGIFADKSHPVEITERVPILRKCQDAPRTTEVETSQLLPEKTKLFLNTSMEMTEAITANKKSTDDHQTQNKTRIFINKSINISETIPIEHSILHPSAYIEKIPPEAENERTDISRIDSIKASEAIPIYNDSYECKKTTNEIQRKSNKRHRQFDFEPTNDCKKISPNISLGEEKTRICLNKSMDVSETMPINRTTNSIKGNSYNQNFIAQEKTKIFHDISMKMIEPISEHPKVCEPNNLLRGNLNEDRTECFPNKSMDITENIPVKQIAFPILEAKQVADHISQNKTKMFTNNSMNISETIPIKQNAPSFRISTNNMGITNMEPVQHVFPTNLNNQKTQIFLDKSMDITETIASNKSDLQSMSQHKNIPDEGTQIFPNTPMDFTSQISTLSNVIKMRPSTNGNNQSVYLNDDANKIFHNATMEFTELPSSFPGTSNNPKTFNQSDFGISPNNVDAIQNSINVSNNFHKRNNYEISDRFSSRDETFHRITSDELNTLCASMNLPTQKYSRDESVNTQTNFIPSCNDVNVLRDSLQKNSMFQGADQFNMESNSRTLNTNNMRESSLMQVRKEGTANMNLLVINRNEIDKSTTIENYFNKSVTGPVMAINEDKTAEISHDHLEQQQIHCGLDQTESRIVHSTNESVIVQNTANVSNYNIQNVYTAVDYCKISEKDSNAKVFPSYVEPEKLSNSKLQIYHDTSMELTTSPLALLTETKSNAITAPIANCSENENCTTSRENSLARLPSDNTDLLIATMGFKTKLTYPLIINDKTTITISNKSLTSKSYSVGTNENCCTETNKTYVVDKSLINQKESSDLIGEQVQNENRNFEIATVENDKYTNDLDEADSSDKDNNELGARINCFSEKCISEELDEIQPPSFLDSDSMHDDLSEQLERLSSDNRLDSILSNSNEQYVLPDEAELRDDISFNDDTMEISKNSEAEKQKRLSGHDSDYSFKNKSNEILFPKEDSIQLTSTSANDKSAKDSIEEPISPFLSLTQSLKAQEIRDDCIWAIRVIKSNVIAIDFISKSFVVIVRLNEMETINCIRDVEKIEFVSTICANSTNILLKIVHKLLLLKFNPDEMVNKYKMYEDILPMLQYISKEVVFSMNFMFDLERLTAMNLITIDIERIMFMVSSRKSNIILKVLLGLKLFHEIGPNDIDVTCVLGDVRKNDIKQLIVNIKKDYKFLSRYINDVKDYITLMENHV